MSKEGHKPAGAPWESYVTDPGEVPNPAEWEDGSVLAHSRVGKHFVSTRHARVRAPQRPN